MKRRRSETSNLALCAICAALSFVVLALGTATAVLDMSACVVAGLATVVMMLETDTAHTACAVAVCFILCAVLLPDKTVAALYLMIGGVYPLVKPIADRLRRVPRIAVKLAAAEISIAVYVAMMKIFMPSEVEGYIAIVFFVLGTLCFFLYDVLLSRFRILYEVRLRKMFRR
ncbi:MAG: hypothetical protein MJ096_00820 [Clostridia bacterium]|nr:hypothetical protein [Clostridia bacterium]